jgi:hypothetical protein
MIGLICQEGYRVVLCIVEDKRQAGYSKQKADNGKTASTISIEYFTRWSIRRILAPRICVNKQGGER